MAAKRGRFTVNSLNKPSFIDAVNEAEKNGPCHTFTELFVKVYQTYNNDITEAYENIPQHTKVAGLIKAMGITTKTTLQTISSAQNVNPKILQKVINQVESESLPRSRSDLFNKVVVLYNRETETSMTLSVLQSVAKDQNLKIKTPKGKSLAQMTPDERNQARQHQAQRVPRGEKFAKNPAIRRSLKMIESSIPKDLHGRFLPIVEKIRGGSVAAAIKLKCIDCSGWCATEVRYCVSLGCALYPFRPFQGKMSQEDLDTVQSKLDETRDDAELADDEVDDLFENMKPMAANRHLNLDID